MATDKLNPKGDSPLANSTTIGEVCTPTAGTEREEMVTVFDVANEIEMALKQLETKTIENDKQFEKSFKLLEETLSRIDQ